MEKQLPDNAYDFYFDTNEAYFTDQEEQQEEEQEAEDEEME